MKIKRLVIPLATLALASLLFPTSARQAYACSCGAVSGYSRVDSALNADAIVIATVTGIIFTPSLEEAPGPVPDRRTDIVLRVEQRLKGEVPDTIQIFAPGFVLVSEGQGSIDSCGTLGLGSLGRLYLLILTERDGAFSDPGICSGSGVVESNYLLPELIDALAHRFPTAGSAPPASETLPYKPWLPVLMGTALLGSSAFLLRRYFASRD